MNDLGKRLRVVAVVAFSYAVTGKLGLLLALPPGYATAIWPPSGIALAAVLLYGSPAAVGTVIGSFAVNAGVGFDSGTPGHFARAVGVALVIASGASLQALAGASLIRRAIGFPHPLNEGTDVLRFSLLGGPVACMTNATVGSTLLLATGAFPLKDYGTNWLTWWAGDVLGVIIVVPIVLSLFAEPRAVWRPRRASVAGPLAAVFAIAVCAYVRASALEQRQLEQEFRERASALERALSSRIDGCVLTIEQTRDFFNSSISVEREEFRRFARPALARLPGLRAIEWIATVHAAERTTYEDALRAEGFASAKLHDYSNAPTPDSREVMSAVTYIEPLENNVRALGLDIGSEALRRAALEQARDSGKATASDGVTFLRRNGDSLGVLIFAPVYQTGANVSTPELRKKEIRGFVLGAFQTGDLVTAALGAAPGRNIAVAIRDASTGRVLYDESVEPSRATLRFDVPVQAAGREWLFAFSSTPAYTATHSPWEAWALLVSALLFGGLLGAFLLVLTGRAAEFERRNYETTELLSTLVQSSEDTIVAYDASGAVMSWNAGAAVTLGFDEKEVLGKDVRAFMPADSLSDHEAKLKQVFAGENLPAYEGARLTRDGRRIDVAVKLSPVRDVHGDVRAVSEICRDISAAKEADRLIRASLREKELLLKEVHHRVKNNLQVISSLLNLQAQHLPDPAQRGIFTDSQSRVQSIALVHEKLYQSKDLTNIDCEQYVHTLVDGLFHAQNYTGRGIEHTIDVGGAHLPVDAAIPCGLIINELVTNALKHAFPGNARGTVHVSLQPGADDSIELVVQDDGRGLPEDIDPRKTTSLGLDLVFTFAEQLEAKVEIERSHGTAFRFRFRQPTTRSALDS
ncbi:MAG TPA: CHASE domain-containing protein [Polyangiaceae bacterium]|nr:CHASE domain-containing protein [Polyangiaceae bacterium]